MSKSSIQSFRLKYGHCSKSLKDESYIGKPGKEVIASKNARMLNGKHLEYYTLSSYIDQDEDDNLNLYDLYSYDDWKDERPLNEYSYFKIYNILECSKARVFTLDKKSLKLYMNNNTRYNSPLTRKKMLNNSIMRELRIIKGLMRGGENE